MLALAAAMLVLSTSPLQVRTPTPFIHEMHDTEDDAQLTVQRNIPFKTIFDLLMQHTEHFHDCTADAGTQVHNKVLLIFDVAPDGAVHNVGISSETASLAHETVVQCFANELRTWKFPATAKGERGIAIPLVTWSQRRAMDGGR